MPNVSFDKAAAEIRAGQAKIADGLSTLNRAAVLFDEARTLLRQAIQGTSRPEAGQALATLGQTIDTLVMHRQAVQAASTAVETYLANVASGVRTVDAQPSTSSAAKPPSVQPKPVTVSKERVDQLRRELPPDITPLADRLPGTPQPKTHGRWIDPSGQVREEISGWDHKYRAAVEWFKSQPNRRRPATASDVEVKLAVHMRLENIRHVTLVINHVPCEGELGCDTLVPQILPAGYTLAVHGARGFRKVYHGRA
jgi:hypothetical protein